MRRFAVAGLFVAALAHVAFANGRPSATSTIHFQEGHEQNIAAGMTFGLLLSQDGGATWHWMCEDAVGYGGMWDPDYSYMQNGTLFGTTFDGLKSMPPGACNFTATSFGTLFVSSDEGKGTTFLFAAADPTDDKIYKSTDQGATFPTSTTPTGATVNDWYTSLIFAPSDPTKVYASGYRFSGQSKVLLLYKSVDGGSTFTTMSQVGLPTMPASASTIDIVGVDPTNPSIVYAKITYTQMPVGDTIYKSINAGQSWTTLRSKADTISFLVRSNGDLVIGTKTLGGEVSTNGGTSWTPLTNPPQINCLVENSAHEVWACTQNYDTQNGSGTVIPGDGYGIMKTTDLATWTGVLKFQDIAGPVPCTSGPQHDSCIAMKWCGLRTQLGITGSGGVDCAAGSGSSSDAGNVHVTPPPKGCCDTGPGTAPPAAMGLVVAIGLLRRRRKIA